MQTAIIIQANSLTHLYFALAVAMVRYDPSQSKIFLSIGQINGNNINLDILGTINFEYLDDKLDEIKKKYKTQSIILITPSHFSYQILFRLGLWRVSKLIRIEEGMGSYGNIISKMTGLLVSGYGKLILRNVIGASIAGILERIKLQEPVFLFDKNNNCNVLLLTKLRQVIENLRPVEELDESYDTLVLSTDFLNKNIELKASFFSKGHPAWGGKNTDEKFQNYTAEALLFNNSIKTIITQFSSASLYAPVLNGVLSVCISDKNTMRQLTARQISLFQKFGYVLIC